MTALEYCDLLTVEKEAIEVCFEEFPEVHEAVLTEAKYRVKCSEIALREDSLMAARANANREDTAKAKALPMLKHVELPAEAAAKAPVGILRRESKPSTQMRRIGSAPELVDMPAAAGAHRTSPNAQTLIPTQPVPEARLGDIREGGMLKGLRGQRSVLSALRRRRTLEPAPPMPNSSMSSAEAVEAVGRGGGAVAASKASHSRSCSWDPSNLGAKRRLALELTGGAHPGGVEGCGSPTALRLLGSPPLPTLTPPQRRRLVADNRNVRITEDLGICDEAREAIVELKAQLRQIESGKPHQAAAAQRQALALTMRLLAWAHGIGARSIVGNAPLEPLQEPQEPMGWQETSGRRPERMGPLGQRRPIGRALSGSVLPMLPRGGAPSRAPADPVESERLPPHPVLSRTHSSSKSRQL